MSNPISPLSAADPALRGIRAGEGASLSIPGSETLSETENASRTFGQCLQDAISQVNDAQLHAADMTRRFAAGEPMDVHQVMIAGQEAGVMLELSMQVRNKLVDAYQEVMRVNI